MDSTELSATMSIPLYVRHAAVDVPSFSSPADELQEEVETYEDTSPRKSIESS